MEPLRLIEGRKKIEIQSGARLIPNPVVVARQHPETIRVRPQIRIKSLAPRTSVSPVRIKSLELVANLTLARLCETEGCVVNFYISSKRPQSHRLRGVNHSAVSNQAFDVNRWNDQIPRQDLRINDRYSFRSPEPELPITCSNGRRLPASVRVNLQAVTIVEEAISHAVRRILLRPVEFGAADARASGTVTQPDSPSAVRKNPQYALAWKAVRGVPGDKSLTVKPAQPALSSYPDSTLAVCVHRVYGSTCQAIGLRVTMKYAPVENHDASLIKSKPHSSCAVSTCCEYCFATQQRLIRKIGETAVGPAVHSFVSIK